MRNGIEQKKGWSIVTRVKAGGSKVYDVMLPSSEKPLECYDSLGNARTHFNRNPKDKEKIKDA